MNKTTGVLIAWTVTCALVTLLAVGITSSGLNKPIAKALNWKVRAIQESVDGAKLAKAIEKHGLPTPPTYANGDPMLDDWLAEDASLMVKQATWPLTAALGITVLVCAGCAAAITRHRCGSP